MARVILERNFDPPVTDDERQRLTGRLAPCLEQHGARWIESRLSVDGRRMICEFEAPDAEAIRTALRTARLRYDRVWSARVVRPPAGASPRRPGDAAS